MVGRQEDSEEQDKDLKSPKDLFKLFPTFLHTDSKGQVNPKTGPFFVSIPASQENVEGDVDDVPVVTGEGVAEDEPAPPALAQEEGARGRLRDRIWRGARRAPPAEAGETFDIATPSGRPETTTGTSSASPSTFSWLAGMDTKNGPVFGFT